MAEWVQRLFDSGQSRLCVVTNPANVDGVKAFFADEKRGRKVVEVSSVDLFQGRKDGEGEEEEDDDDDEDEEDGADEDDGEDDDDDEEDVARLITD